MIPADIDFNLEGIAYFISAVLGALGTLFVTIWGGWKGYQKVIMPLWDQRKKTESDIRINESINAAQLDKEAQQRLADHYQKLIKIKEGENENQDRRITRLEELQQVREKELRDLIKSEAECKATLAQLTKSLTAIEERLRWYEDNVRSHKRPEEKGGSK